MTNLNYLENDYIYDIETYPNVFTLATCSGDGKVVRVWEVSDRMNQTTEILNYLRHLAKNKWRQVGFNNLGFDYPVLHWIMQQAIEAKRNNQEYYINASEVYDFAMKQIQTARDGFASVVKTEDEIIPQIDLFKINHFDNKARMTSLKMLEFNMLSDNIADLPFPVGKHLTHSEIDVLKFYNLHDVAETKKFYHHNISAIRLREDLSKKYSYNFMNHNDTKIGKDYFILELEKHQKGICYTINARGHRKMNQTKHKSIKIKDCLFDYYDFKRPEFIALKDWFSKQTIKETKGVFTDIEEHLLFDVAKYAEMETKRVKFKSKPTEKDIAEFMKLHPLGWIEEQELKALETVKDENGNALKETYIDENGKEKTRVVRKPKISYYGCYRIATSLNVVINGFRFDYGLGGIHGSVSSQIVRVKDNEIMEDADVASMYPNIGISNKVYPMHLGETFCKIYEDVYNQRKSFAKGTPENAVMKLALNGVYGDSNNEFSPFYDASYTMKITINGQLSLSLLAERLIDNIPDLFIVQVNTDGITVKYDRKYKDIYDSICEQWQKDVKLELEFAEYDVMYIRDVNNYIASYTNGKKKFKGAYVYDELGWHQNHSAKVIQMAASEQMLNGTPVEDFIRNHKNKYDFLLRTKVPRSSSLVLVTELDDGEYEEQKLQNICRYYPCKEGGQLIKIMPPLEGKTEFRRLGIDVGWNVAVCNNIEDFKWNVDYDYYTNEALKLVIEENPCE